MATLKVLSLVFCSFIKVCLVLDFFLFICLRFLGFFKIMYWCLSSIGKILPLIRLNSASDAFCLPPHPETPVKHILNFIIVSFYTPYYTPYYIISPHSCPLPPEFYSGLTFLGLYSTSFDCALHVSNLLQNKNHWITPFFGSISS